SAQNHRIAADRYRHSELIKALAVGGEDFLLLVPGDAASHEDICRTLILERDHIVNRADDDGVAADGDRETKLIERRAVASKEVLLLAPGRAAPDEHISRSLIRIKAVVILRCADNHCAAADADRIAEEVTCRAVAGGEFLLLAPGDAASDEDVRGTLIATR